MNKKKLTREDIGQLDSKERMKYEIAEELGILDRVLEEGWRSLSAKETGKIGGIINSRKKKQTRGKTYGRQTQDEGGNPSG